MGGRKARPIEERFWEKVDKADSDDCWPWTGTVDATRMGHGVMRVGSRSDGSRKRVYAHRLAYEIAVGPVPEGMCVCHECDNPPCVNPAHLFLGTKSDNTQDMMAKGRHAQRLTDEQVSEVISARLSGRKLTDVASEFGITPGYVANLALGRKRVQHV